jgi:hypothetical protein
MGPKAADDRGSSPRTRRPQGASRRSASSGSALTPSARREDLDCRGRLQAKLMLPAKPVSPARSSNANKAARSAARVLRLMTTTMP